MDKTNVKNKIKKYVKTPFRWVIGKTGLLIKKANWEEKIFNSIKEPGVTIGFTLIIFAIVFATIAIVYQLKTTFDWNLAIILDENTTTFMGATVLTSLATSVTTFIFLYDTNQDLKKKEGYYAVVIDKYQTNIKTLIISILILTSLCIMVAMVICIAESAAIAGYWVAFVAAALVSLLIVNAITQYGIIKSSAIIARFAKEDLNNMLKEGDHTKVKLYKKVKDKNGNEREEKVTLVIKTIKDAELTQEHSNKKNYKPNPYTCSQLLGIRHLVESVLRKNPSEKYVEIRPEHIYDGFKNTEKKLEFVLKKLKKSTYSAEWQNFIDRSLKGEFIGYPPILKTRDENVWEDIIKNAVDKETYGYLKYIKTKRKVQWQELMEYILDEEIICNLFDSEYCDLNLEEVLHETSIEYLENFKEKVCAQEQLTFLRSLNYPELKLTTTPEEWHNYIEKENNPVRKKFLIQLKNTICEETWKSVLFNLVNDINLSKIHPAKYFDKKLNNSCIAKQLKEAITVVGWKKLIENIPTKMEKYVDKLVEISEKNWNSFLETVDKTDRRLLKNLRLLFGNEWKTFIQSIEGITDWQSVKETDDLWKWNEYLKNHDDCEKLLKVRNIIYIKEWKNFNKLMCQPRQDFKSASDFKEYYDNPDKYYEYLATNILNNVNTSSEDYKKYVASFKEIMVVEGWNTFISSISDDDKNTLMKRNLNNYLSRPQRIIVECAKNFVWKEFVSKIPNDIVTYLTKIKNNMQLNSKARKPVDELIDEIAFEMNKNLEYYWIVNYCLFYISIKTCYKDNRDCFTSDLSEKCSKLIEIGERYDTFLKFYNTENTGYVKTNDVPIIVPSTICESYLLLNVLINQTIDDTDLSKMKLAHISFYGSDLTGADLTSADIHGCDFTEAKLCNTKLGEIIVDSSSKGLLYGGVIFKGADFSNAKFGKINFGRKVILEDSTFSSSLIRDAVFDKVNMKTVNMTDMNIGGSVFTDVKMDFSSFTDTIFDNDLFESEMDDLIIMIRKTPNQKLYDSIIGDKDKTYNIKITISGTEKFKGNGKIRILTDDNNFILGKNTTKTFIVENPFSSLFKFDANTEESDGSFELTMKLSEDDNEIEMNFEKTDDVNGSECFIAPMISNNVDWNTKAGDELNAVLNQNKGCDFEGSIFNKSHITNSLIHWANMRNISFIDSRIVGCYISGTWFSESKFLRSELGNTTSVKSTFINCNFNRCVFDETSISNIKFVHCNFNNVKFINSKIISTTFEECSFSDAVIEKVYFNNVKINDCVDFSERDYNDYGEFTNSYTGNGDFFLATKTSEKNTPNIFNIKIDSCTFVDTFIDGSNVGALSSGQLLRQLSNYKGNMQVQGSNTFF